jgi:hypothetical protein
VNPVVGTNLRQPTPCQPHGQVASERSGTQSPLKRSAAAARGPVGNTDSHQGPARALGSRPGPHQTARDSAETRPRRRRTRAPRPQELTLPPATDAGSREPRSPTPTPTPSSRTEGRRSRARGWRPHPPAPGRHLLGSSDPAQPRLPAVGLGAGSVPIPSAARAAPASPPRQGALTAVAGVPQPFPAPPRG